MNDKLYLGITYELWYTVLLSFLLLHSIFQFLKSYVFSHLPKRDCVLCSSYFVSLIHVLPVVAIALRESYIIITQHDDVIAAFGMQNTEAFKYGSAFLAGYMIYDIIEIIRNEEIYDALFLIHHPVSFIGAFVGMQGIYESLILPYYLGEIPVIFINIATISSILKPDANLLVVKLLSGLNFILFRLLWTPILPYFIITRCGSFDQCFPDMPRFAALFTVFTTLSVLNFYWFTKSLLDFLSPSETAENSPTAKKEK